LDVLAEVASQRLTRALAERARTIRYAICRMMSGRWHGSACWTTSPAAWRAQMLLRRMNHADLTVHGFRSCFKDWASELTNYPAELSEAALGHVIGDRVEAAYRRGDLFIKRRDMMAAWAAFCAQRYAQPAGNVVTLRTA
jgi:hypothetical protein